MQTHTFYIDKRRGKAQISLDGDWNFTYIDTATDSTEELDFANIAQIPSSSYKNLQQAGILPNPYLELNSKLYNWVDKKIWYYRKTFSLPETDGKDVFLCFDGVGYSCRVWLNGKLICEHEGMFGGPVTEVGEFVRSGENELIVEVTPPATDYSHNPARDKRSLSEIVPWNLRRDANTSNGDFVVFGIWRSVRIEILPKYHMSRPYLHTESISGGKATLKLEVELVDPQIKELEVVANDIGQWSRYTFAYSEGIDLRPTGKRLDIAVTLTEKSTGNLAYSSRETVEIYDKAYICADKTFRDCTR